MEDTHSGSKVRFFSFLNNRSSAVSPPGNKSSADASQLRWVPPRKEPAVIANNLQPYRNTRDDLPFQFLGVPTLLRATADTTNGAFGLIEHPMLPPGSHLPTMFITVKTNLFMCFRDAWHSCATASGSPPDRATSCSVPRIFRTASRLQARRPLRCCCWCRPAALSDLQRSRRASWYPPSPPDIAKLVAVAANYGVDILGPLPEEAP